MSLMVKELPVTAGNVADEKSPGYRMSIGGHILPAEYIWKRVRSSDLSYLTPSLSNQPRVIST